MTSQILVCVHDVSPRHADALERIHAELCQEGLMGRYSMLVVPNFWHEWPLDAAPDFRQWLRQRAAEGTEMILHGFYHRDETRHANPWVDWKARTLTAREGEFLGLTYREAVRRLRAGRTMVSDAVGAPVTGFVAPAWLYSDGARRALRDEGFEFAEDHGTVWLPKDGRVILRGPVVSYASRDLQRVVGSLLWSRLSTIVLRGQSIVRFAIHPHDMDVPVLWREVKRALRVLCSSRSAVTYGAYAATVRNS